ncbi:MAG: DnaK suppressor protein [Pseudomonadales bacterium]|jgi:DnaK suppressor protein
MNKELTPQQIDQLALLINNQLHEFTVRIDSLHEQAEPVVLDQQSIGRVSRIDAITQQQIAKAGERQAIEKIKQLHAAQLKISDDDYGWCEACGDAIGFERLSIQPEVIKCLRCQQIDEINS